MNNTFINDLGSGTFVADTTSTPAVIENNIFYKAGTISGQAAATLTTNFDGTSGANPGFTNVASYDVTLLSTSACIDKGTSPGSAGSQSLSPVFEYVHPLSEVARTVVGPAIDIGAYEYGVSDDAGVVGPDASPPDASGSGSGGSGSSSGGSSSGGSSSTSSGAGSSSGSTSSSSGAGTGDGGNGASPKSSGGCGCVLTSASDAEAAGLGGLAGLLFVGVARRRARRSRG